MKIHHDLTEHQLHLAAHPVADNAARLVLEATLVNADRGYLVVQLDHGTYWQCVAAATLVFIGNNLSGEGYLVDEDGSIYMTLGDAGGVESFFIHDVASGNVFEIDSDGNIDAMGDVTVDVVLDDGAGDSPSLKFVGGSNDDTVEVFLDDDAVAGDSDLVVILADAVGDSEFIIQSSTPAEVFSLTSYGNLSLTVGAGTGIYVNQTYAAAGNIGWFDFTSTAAAGDITGLRPRVHANAAGVGANARGTYSEVIIPASKFAALAQGVMAHVTVGAGDGEITTTQVIMGQFSTGASFTGTDVYVGYLRAQTRDDETIGGNYSLLALENEAVGGNGLQIDSAIRVLATNVTGAFAFDYGIDFSGATGEIATGDILLSDGASLLSGVGDSFLMAGDFGVGTITPDRLLHAEVSDAVTNTVTFAERLTHITSGAAAANFGVGLEFELEDDGGGMDVAGAIQTIWTSAAAGAEESSMQFLTTDVGDDGLAVRVTIDKDGRVGVGITTPGEQLHVVNPNDGFVRLSNLETNVTAKAGAVVSTHYTTAEEPLTLIRGYSALNAGLVQIGGGTGVGNAATIISLFTAANNTTVTGTERVRIASDGKVGVGTVAADRLLHAEVSDAVVNAVTYVERLSHISSGNPVAGFGTGIEFELEENDNSNRVAAYITADWEDAGEGASADGRLNFGVMTGDAAAATAMLIWNGLISMGGAFAPTGQLHIDQSNNAGAIPVIKLDQADDSEGYFDFIGNTAASAVGPISTWTVANLVGYVRCEINGAAQWLAYYDAPTA